MGGKQKLSSLTEASLKLRSLESEQRESCLVGGTGSVKVIPRIPPTVAWVWHWFQAVKSRDQSLYMYSSQHPGLATEIPEGMLSKDQFDSFGSSSQDLDLLTKQLVGYSQTARGRQVQDVLRILIKILLGQFRIYDLDDMTKNVLTVIRKEAHYTNNGFQVFHHAMTSSAYVIYRCLRILMQQYLPTTSGSQHMQESRPAGSAAASTVKSRVQQLAIDGLLAPCLVDWAKVSPLALSRAQEAGLSLSLQESAELSSLMAKGQAADIISFLSKRVPNDHVPALKSRLTSTNYSLFGNWPDLGESTLIFLLQSFSMTSPTSFIQSIPFLTQTDKNIIDKCVKDVGAAGILQPRLGILLLFAIPCSQIDRFAYDSWGYGLATTGSPSGGLSTNFLGNTFLPTERPWKDFFATHQHQARLMDLCYGEKSVAARVVREIVHFYPQSVLDNIDQVILTNTVVGRKQDTSAVQKLFEFMFGL